MLERRATSDCCFRPKKMDRYINTRILFKSCAAFTYCGMFNSSRTDGTGTGETIDLQVPGSTILRLRILYVS